MFGDARDYFRLIAEKMLEDSSLEDIIENNDELVSEILAYLLEEGMIRIPEEYER
jgi:hypothetical protein